MTWNGWPRSASRRSGRGSSVYAWSTPRRPSKTDAGPVKPAMASCAATMPAWPAQPALGLVEIQEFAGGRRGAEHAGDACRVKAPRVRRSGVERVADAHRDLVARDD